MPGHSQSVMNKAISRYQPDKVFSAVSFLSALMVFAVLLGLILSLLSGSQSALTTFGLSFVYRDVWDPINGEFGAAAAIYGTLVSAFIACLIAVPLSLGIAVFLSELAPRWVSAPVGKAIELLAAIPSIIFGMWGLFVFCPWFSDSFQMWAGEHLAEWPLIGPLFNGPPIGIGLLSAGIILAFMILPIITSLTRDALASIPNILRETAYGIGANPFEVITKVLLPSVRRAVLSACILGLGRALGETMAVTFVIGGANRIQA
ncbi:phosphate ABC transporter permease subunit PstC, partial [Vibrio parahaemolyticus]|uniref:phosphate ABC transporter permease subunit PstC n=2 Tax=Vibrionaceae TaxID=641 RepID=UPI001EEB3EF7|nr:phosphate ABC transporter permease subunit PstC [Vibrio parahaemolyticus]